MTLTDLITGPWMLVPSVLCDIQAAFEARLRGEAPDAELLAQFEARSSERGSQSERRYEVIDGVAVLPIEGVLAPKANLMTMLCGGMSMQMIGAELQRAVADNRVDSVLLAIDSPGGNVIGSFELAKIIRDAAAAKPVVAFSDGQMASAAMLQGSAANARFISGPVVMTGSIGVVATHRNDAGPNGSPVTEITAGKYKRIASSNGPLTKEGRAHMQEQVDYIYAQFVDVVAANLGTTPQTVLEHMADGRTFIGAQAIDAGLVNGITTMDALLADMASNPGRYAKRSAARPRAISAPAKGAKSTQASASPEALFSSTDEKENVMSEAAQASAPALTRETLERDHPALFAQLRTEFSAAGATAERERIQGVRAQVLPGHEALIERLAFDGVTTPGDAAMAVNAAERQVLGAAATAHANDAPAAVPASPTAGAAGEKSRADMAAEASQYAAEHGIGFTDAMKKLGYA